ncbi:hypothetical protein ACOSP7_005149 [Xanthoceras sorbifolium]|uniref:Uncharacterized protein n=1 Tax=Xanthoceras sorbifolium TaxID=99658 RepID=A0ABQ8IF85_9ROSI|nr:hypothetical protein JRO89_XS02G0085300 [Xanthoceras sorbifolium]
MGYQAFVLIISLFTLTALHGIYAEDDVVFGVFNKAPATPGGIRFKDEIGHQHAHQTMRVATDFIWRVLNQHKPADRRSYECVTMSVVEFDNNNPSGTSNNKVKVNTKYIYKFNGDVKRAFTGVMYHELTRVWQWKGNGQAPIGLINGIADFVRLRAYYPAQDWVKPGEGSRWDEGYSVTAYFLDYCESLKRGFVANLNKKMKDGYSDNFFEELLGMSVDELWNDYKAMYNKIRPVKNI